MNFQDFFNIVYNENFNHALDFLANPENKNKSFGELMDDFRKSGGEELGSGYFGKCYTHPNWNYVLKTFYADDCYIKFIRFAQHLNVPFFPKFVGSLQKILPQFTRHWGQEYMYLIRMEKLEPLNKYDIAMYDSIGYKSLMGIEYAHRKQRDNEITPSVIDDMAQGHSGIIGVLTGMHMLMQSNFLKTCQEDLHSHNIMIRPSTKEWVIIDPFFPLTDDRQLKIRNKRDAVEKAEYDRHVNGKINPKAYISGGKKAKKKNKI